MIANYLMFAPVCEEKRKKRKTLNQMVYQLKAGRIRCRVDEFELHVSAANNAQATDFKDMHTEKLGRYLSTCLMQTHL